MTVAFQTFVDRWAVRRELAAPEVIGLRGQFFYREAAAQCEAGATEQVVIQRLDQALTAFRNPPIVTARPARRRARHRSC